MEQESALLDIFLYIGYFLVIFAVAAAIILPLIKSLDHPQSLIKVGGGVVLLLVIFGISYALSDGGLIARDTDITEQGSKLIGGALIMMYILLFLAIIGIAVTEVSKFFR
jgi:hypothetical protein